MAEKLAKVTGAQNEVPPSSAIEIAGAMAEAIAATTAAAGSRGRNFRARRFRSRAIASALFHADPQSRKAFGTTA
jgi:hypothetical protein